MKETVGFVVKRKIIFYGFIRLYAVFLKMNLSRPIKIARSSFQNSGNVVMICIRPIKNFFLQAGEIYERAIKILNILPANIIFTRVTAILSAKILSRLLITTKMRQNFFRLSANKMIFKFPEFIMIRVLRLAFFKIMK